MTFDEKGLKAAVETVRLPEDMGERLFGSCLAARGEAPGEQGAKRGRSAPRRAVRAGILACAALCVVVAVGFGLWRTGVREGVRPEASEPAEEGAPLPSEETLREESSLPAGESAGESTEGSAEEEPFTTICLHSREELEELREVALNADDEALEAYLRRMGLMFYADREDLLALLETLDTLPYLPFLEGAPVSVAYLPQLPMLTVALEGENGERVELKYEIFFDNPERRMTYLQDLAAELPSLIEPFDCCDGRVTVYVEGRGRDRDGQIYVVFWYAVVDGILVRVDYYTDEPERIVAEEIFDGLEIGTVP